MWREQVIVATVGDQKRGDGFLVQLIYYFLPDPDYLGQNNYGNNNNSLNRTDDMERRWKEGK